MQVRLLYHTPDPERAVYIAARLCYSKHDIKDIERESLYKSPKDLIERLKRSGHLSVFEHAVFTFSLEGVSRVMTHQLVRHRIASYSQRSQRYVDEIGFNYVVPPSVRENPEAEKIFREIMKKSEEAYRRLCSLGIDKEDARYLIPQGIETKIIVTMNARELLHFFTLRCCMRAQWEIRETAKRMLSLAKRVAPLIFKDAGPSCVRGECSEGEFSCGKAGEVRREFSLL